MKDLLRCWSCLPLRQGFSAFTTPDQNVLCALGFATGCVGSGY